MKTCILQASRALVPALFAITSLACSKSDPPSPAATATAVPNEAPTIAIMGTPPAAVAVASASASAVASASAKSTSKTATAATTTAAVTAAAKTRDAPPLKPASSHLDGNHFTLDVASPGCRVDVPCAVTLHVAAVGDFHVNKEYPYKFTASAAPNVTYLGNGDPNTFSRASGDFHEDGEKAGTMTVRFKPSASGNAKVAGVYKMSVCSAEQCQIETQTVALDVPVQ